MLADPEDKHRVERVAAQLDERILQESELPEEEKNVQLPDDGDGPPQTRRRLGPLYARSRGGPPMSAEEAEVAAEAIDAGARAAAAADIAEGAAVTAPPMGERADDEPLKRRRRERGHRHHHLERYRHPEPRGRQTANMTKIPDSTAEKVPR